MTRLLLPALGLFLVATSAHAEGRTELSQTTIEADGGFPHVLSTPGSYVLTSDLVVNTVETGALIFDFPGAATLDLNGFGIYGQKSCSIGACAIGLGAGIDAQGALSIHNGTVSGFSDNCVSGGLASHVADLAVSECGRHGIVIAGEGIAMGNRVRDVGVNGLRLGPGSILAENTVLRAGHLIPGGGLLGIEDGTATGPNVCDDGSCSLRGTRRYYLTNSTVTGANALTACAARYHLASIFEIAELSILEYDLRRGYREGDSGRGPPVSSSVRSWVTPGWVRNGFTSQGSDLLSNCNAWTSSSGSVTGTQARVDPPVLDMLDNFLATGSSWFMSEESCSTPSRAWCIED